MGGPLPMIYSLDNNVAEWIRLDPIAFEGRQDILTAWNTVSSVMSFGSCKMASVTRMRRVSNLRYG